MRVPLIGGVVRDAETVASTTVLLARTGVLAPVRPTRLFGMASAFARYGTTLGAALAAGRARHPDRVAVIDDLGATTYAELDLRANVIAHELAERGIEARSRVGVLARNSAEFVAVVGALSKLGATTIYLNTGFAGMSLANALDDEGVTAVVYDEEFGGLLEKSLADRLGVVVETLPKGGEDSEPAKPAKHGGQVILTSGTTGRAKGAERAMPSGLAALEPITALLGAIPLRAGQPTVVAAPMFHTWGFAHLGLGLALGSTLVVRRKFDSATTLADVERTQATALVVVPVMLQRMCELSEGKANYDVSSLRVVAVSGSALPIETARRFSERYADAVYNLYGSTEVAYASVATPRDFREAPGSVGRPLRGGVVEILDDKGEKVPAGEVGRIFVGNPMTFAGYTSGGDKDRVGGLVATGDVGRFDDNGRLFVEGRDDDMVISGGENIFPQQVEELLLARSEVADAAVVGVPDEKFGARLVAHVVPRDGDDVDVEALKAHIRESLGRIYVPRDVVMHDELPRNETGKVLKRELREQE